MSTPAVQVHSPKDVPQIQGSDEKTSMEVEQAMITQDSSQVVTVSLAPPGQQTTGLMKVDSPMICNAPTQAEVAPAQTAGCAPVVQQAALTATAASTPGQQPTASVPPQLLPATPQSQASLILSGGTVSQQMMTTLASHQQSQVQAHQQQQQQQQQQVATQISTQQQEIRITVLGPADEQHHQQHVQQAQQVQATLTQSQPLVSSQQQQHQQQQLSAAHAQTQPSVQQTAPPQPATPQQLAPPVTPVPPSAPIEEEVKSSGPPKAMVKPQVLTHVIEGYVIHESSEPFPINKGPLLTEMAKTVKSKTTIKDNNTTLDADEPPLKKTNVETPPSTAAAGRGPTGAAVKRTKCESCAGDDKNKKKRFCNVSCHNRANGVTGKKKGAAEDKIGEKGLEVPLTPYNKKDWEDTNDSATSGGMESASSDACDNNATSGGALITPEQMELENLPKTNPVKWTVSDVCDFIRNLPGCCDYVEDFAIQEIDGQALLLLKEDHLMSAMSMKLGPALKICARIDTLRNIAEGGGGGSGATGQQQQQQPAQQQSSTVAQTGQPQQTPAADK